MLLILPASKTQRFQSDDPIRSFTQPLFLKEAAQLVAALRALSPGTLAARMKLSEPLAREVANRYRSWCPPFTPHNARPALHTYAGDLYAALDASALSAEERALAQRRVRILSGLYGLLRPQDLMQPYRLEMGARLDVGNLYAFWGSRLTEALNADLEKQGEPVLLNLASEEYARAIHPAKLRGRIITPVFQEAQNGGFRVVSFSAKRARGLMARHILRNRLDAPDPLKEFQEEGYRYSEADSSPERWIFRRPAKVG